MTYLQIVDDTLQLDTCSISHVLSGTSPLHKGSHGLFEKLPGFREVLPAPAFVRADLRSCLVPRSTCRAPAFSFAASHMVWFTTLTEAPWKQCSCRASWSQCSSAASVRNITCWFLRCHSASGVQPISRVAPGPGARFTVNAPVQLAFRVRDGHTTATVGWTSRCSCVSLQWKVGPRPDASRGCKYCATTSRQFHPRHRFCSRPSRTALFVPVEQKKQTSTGMCWQGSEGCGQ